MSHDADYTLDRERDFAELGSRVIRYFYIENELPLLDSRIAAIAYRFVCTVAPFACAR